MISVVSWIVVDQYFTEKFDISDRSTLYNTNSRIDVTQDSTKILVPYNS